MNTCENITSLVEGGGNYISELNNVSIVFFFRESRRKTPTAVCLKENERLFGDGALGVV